MTTKQDVDELARILGGMTAAQLKLVNYVLDKAVAVYETSQYLDKVDFLAEVNAILAESEADD